jgi:hypothetical protein
MMGEAKKIVIVVKYILIWMYSVLLETVNTLE